MVVKNASKKKCDFKNNNLTPRTLSVRMFLILVCAVSSKIKYIFF